MRLLVTQEPNKCTRCAGFGIFRGVDGKCELIECPSCGSLHPESLGLRYEKDSAKPFRFIVINNPLEKWKKMWENL
jgi:hypothetical protein